MAANGLMYTVTQQAVVCNTNAWDIFEFAAAAGVPVLIHEIRLTSNATTDVRYGVQVIRRTAAATGGANSVTYTPKPTNKRNTVAAASTVKGYNNSTASGWTVGTAGDLLDGDQWSVLVPYSRIFTPDCRIDIQGGGFLGFGFSSAPAAITVNATIFFEEI